MAVSDFINTRLFKGTLRLYSILTFNCGSICEHLLFVQDKTITKIVRGLNNVFSWIFKILHK